MPGDKYVKERTLCWDCVNATGKCSWSDYWEHSPVPGWEAEPTKLKINDGTYCDSYIVKRCPLFEPDPPRFNSGI